MECVLYGIVCSMFYCVDNEKALISVDDSQERELHVGLCRLVLGIFETFFFLDLCVPL